MELLVAYQKDPAGYNIAKFISKETGLPVQIADDPISCVVLGTGKALDEGQTFSTLLVD